MEKQYLRLTGLPDVTSIRPEKVLRESLQYVLSQYSQHSDYSYICEQLKSIRQDLTVQSCKGQFCVHVYEVHARLALGHHDLEEYNQCQSRLQEMRAKGATASVSAFDEFGGYRLLYALHVGNALELSRTLVEVEAGRLSRLRRLKLDPPSFPVIDFALRVVTAWRSHNAHQLSQCWQHSRQHRAPSLVPVPREGEGSGLGELPASTTCTQQACFLMDALLAKQRLSSLQRVLKAFDSIPLSHLYSQLGFADPLAGLQFLRDRNIAPQFVRLEGQEQPFLDCRAALAATAETAAFALAASAVTGKGKKRARGDVEAEGEERGGGGGGLGLEGALSKKQKRRLVKLQKVQQKNKGKGKA